MDRGFRRTFVTVDEAVAILIKWVDGPVVYGSIGENPSLEDQELLDGIEFCLQEELEEEKDTLASEWAEAKFDKLPSSIIEAKRKAVQSHALVMAQAKAYFCAIDDEINIGKASALRWNRAIASRGGICISLTSLNEWAASKGYDVQVLTPIPTAASPEIEIEKGKKKIPVERRRQRDQEEAIVAEIIKLGYKPLELPINKPGKNGVKSAVWKTLHASDLFSSKNVFDDAWQRTRDNKDILNAA